MAQNKNALLRYRLIDKALRNAAKPFPSKDELRTLCEEQVFGSDFGQHICDSTIEKDIFAMRNDYDAPIRYSVKERGYYYADPKFSLENSPLSESDLRALKVATSTLAQFRNNAQFQEFGHAIDRIISTVDEKNYASKNSIIQFETGFGSSGQEYITPLIESIEQGAFVYFDYQSFNSSSPKRRKVAPLLLKEYRNRWYLICFDSIRERILTFGLDRMSNLERSSELHKLSIDFKPEVYFEYTVGITVSSSQPELVRMKAQPIAAKYLESDPIHKSQKKVKEGKKRVTFEMEVYVTEELIRNILSYGAEIEVVEPLSLREEIITRLRAMSLHYQI